MKTKYSTYILMLLTLLFSFSSCEKDELDTWVSLEADKTKVAVNETVSFKIAGNAETYVVYTGDAGHDFAKSYLVVTQGKKIDQEEYVLTQAKLDTWTPILTAEIDAWNLVISNAPIDAATVFADLSELVDKPYFFDTAYQNLMAILNLSGSRTIPDTFKTKTQCETSVTTYFTDNSVLLAPEGGFSTGKALNRNSLTYSYKFTTAGTYVVTLLGTKLSNKNYSGSGYIDDRTSSASEYDYRRNTATVTIVVQ
jgi:hypothetical protein